MVEDFDEKGLYVLNQLKNLIRKHGGRVDSGNSDCIAWMSEHNGSCAGCSSNLGCTKLTQLLRLQLPVNLEEKQVIELMKGVLKAQTVEGVVEAYP